MFRLKPIISLYTVAVKFVPQATLNSICFNRLVKVTAINKSFEFSLNDINKMSQKSITSFFKSTPKTSPEVKDKKEKPNPISTAEEKVKCEEETNELQDSVSTKTNENTSPASSPEKITKQVKRSSKRQRIDSSESETEAPIKVETLNDKASPEKPEEITLNKLSSPKIYQSPKTKKAKIKQEKTSPAVKKKIEKKEIIEEENSSPEPEKRISKKKKDSSEEDKSSPEPEKSSGEKKKDSTEEENSSPEPEKRVSKRQRKSLTPLKTKKEKLGVEKSSKTKTPVQTKKEKSEQIEKSPSETKSKKEGSKSFANFFTKKENGDAKKENGTKEEDKKIAECDYNPSKAKYHPIDDACWCKDEDVPYLALAKTLEAIEGTSARLKMIEILANFFRSVIVLTPEDLLPSVYMCLNQLAPAYHSLELGIAETYLMKAVGQCTGRSLSQMKAAMQKTGDLGSVAEQARSTQKTMFAPPPLKAKKVFAALKEIAHMTGQASVNKKIAKIQSLYVACRHSEAKYLIRSLEGKLRIGLAEQSVLQALALAASLTPPASDILDASKGLAPDDFKAKVDANALVLKTTYCECPSYDAIVPVLLQHGLAALPQHCRLTPGVPLKPMLAHPTKGVHEVFNRFEGIEFTCEWKYDGERAQIHVPGEEKPDLGNAAIFSRNQENNTSKYPDVLRRLQGLLRDDVTSCVLDCEAVAYDTTNKQILPFQILSTRKRKDAAESDIKVQVCVFVFDLLYLNGTPLVNEPLAKRRELLRKHFNEVEGEWQFATSKDCVSMEEVQQFLEESVRGSCEGLMVKTLVGDHAKYDIARRSRNWLKLKKDYLDGVGDTIDCVVIGGYRGRGRRAGLLGGFLLACADPDADEYQALCKLGTGFTDEDLATLTKSLEEHIIDTPRNYYRYDVSHMPDVWVSATQVWEVRCADLSLSPAHRAAIGRVDPDKGISLRFPRFVRVRDDKTPEQATTARQIADMYLSQDQVKNSNKTQTNHDDFY